MRKILPAGLTVGAIGTAAALSACGASARPVAVAGPAPSPAASGPAAHANGRATLHTARMNVDGHPRTIIVTEAGRPVYLLTGDKSSHPLCTSAGCQAVWPTVDAAHPTTAGVSGHLGVWRHAGLAQVTLDGHPLYTYAGDSGGSASGQGIHSFGGTWLVLSPSGQAIGGGAAPRSAAAPGSNDPSGSNASAASSSTGNTGSSSGSGW